MTTMATLYRGTCTCGWHGRALRDEEAAYAAANHHIVTTHRRWRTQPIYKAGTRDA